MYAKKERIQVNTVNQHVDCKDLICTLYAYLLITNLIAVEIIYSLGIFPSGKNSEYILLLICPLIKQR